MITVRKTSSASETVMMMWLVTVNAPGIIPIRFAIRMNMNNVNTSGKNFIPSLPAVERNVWLPDGGEQQSVQALIGNQLDAGPVMPPAAFPALFRGNPKVTTYTGRKQPFGYMDWWPLSLYLNNQRVADASRCVMLSDAVDGQFLVLRKGQKNYYLVKVIG